MLISKLQKIMDSHVEQNLECGCQLVIYQNGDSGKWITIHFFLCILPGKVFCRL